MAFISPFFIGETCVIILKNLVSGGVVMISVAAAIIFHRQKLLICQRPQGAHCELLWEFPGGKVEAGELPQDCVVRECQEELDLSILPEKIFAETTFLYPDREISFTFFLSRLKKEHLTVREHHAVRWVTREELNHYQFCPADEEVIARIEREWDNISL